MFAGKKSAQIREILISESAWEEMTCLFAPSLANKPDLLEKYHDSRLIRMSIKNDEGKVGKVELYDLSGTLIFESYKNK